MFHENPGVFGLKENKLQNKILEVYWIMDDVVFSPAKSWLTN